MNSTTGAQQTPVCSLSLWGLPVQFISLMYKWLVHYICKCLFSELKFFFKALLMMKCRISENAKVSEFVISYFDGCFCCDFLSPGTVIICLKPRTSSVTIPPPSRRSSVGSETLTVKVHTRSRVAASGSSTSETLPRDTTAASLTSDL